MKGIGHFGLKFSFVARLVWVMFLVMFAVYPSDAAEVKSVTVGAKAFAENQIVGKLIQYALEDAGFKVKFIPDLENAVLQKAIESGEIDLCPEYTNTGITSILKLKPIVDKEEAYRTVKEEYEKRFGITWLEPSGINNTYCLVITKEASDAYGIKTISDLQANAANIRAAKQNSWRERPDHLPGLEPVYGPFVFKDETIYDNGLKYQILLTGKGDLTLGYTTDPQLEDGKLLALEDDKNFWAPYYLVPIIRQDTLAKYPEIEGIVNSVTKKLNRADIIRLSANVVLRHEEYSDVAKEYYESGVAGK